jgi:hypothetical protein
LPISRHFIRALIAISLVCWVMMIWWWLISCDADCNHATLMIFDRIKYW